MTDGLKPFDYCLNIILIMLIKELSLNSGFLLGWK